MKTYNAASQLLVSIPPTGGPITSTNDNNGNPLLQNTGGSLTTLTWDYENRLASNTSPGGLPVTYVYSADDKRQATISSAGTTNYVWDGNILLQENNASGITQVQYTQGPGDWGLLIARTAAGVPTYYGPDNQENVRLLMNMAGAVTGIYYTDAFGNNYSAPAATNNLNWTGNVGGYLEISGLIRYMHRLYYPVSGRFINDDPIGFDGGDWNLRTYVGNNATGGVDPSGTTACTQQQTYIGIDCYYWRNRLKKNQSVRHFGTQMHVGTKGDCQGCQCFICKGVGTHAGDVTGYGVKLSPSLNFTFYATGPCAALNAVFAIAIQNPWVALVLSLVAAAIPSSWGKGSDVYTDCSLTIQTTVAYFEC